MISMEDLTKTAIEFEARIEQLSEQGINVAKLGAQAVEVALQEERTIMQIEKALNIPQIIVEWEEQCNSANMTSRTMRELIMEKVACARGAYVAHASVLEQLRKEADESIEELNSYADGFAHEMKEPEQTEDRTALHERIDEEYRAISNYQRYVGELALMSVRLYHAVLYEKVFYVTTLKRIYAVIAFRILIIELFSYDSYNPKPMIQAIATLLMTSASVVARLVAGFSSNPEAVIIANGIDNALNIYDDIASVKEAYDTVHQMHENGSHKRQQAKKIAVGDKLTKKIEDDIDRFTLAYVLFDHLANGRSKELEKLAQALGIDTN